MYMINIGCQYMHMVHRNASPNSGDAHTIRNRLEALKWLSARSGSPSALGPTLKLVMPCSRHRGSYAQIVPFDE